MRHVTFLLAMVGCVVLAANVGSAVAGPVGLDTGSDGSVTRPARLPVHDGKLTGLPSAGDVIVPAGPAITSVVAGQADGLILVDVYVSGVDVRGYQVGLDASHGKLVDIWVDADRADYVFGASRAVTAVDIRRGRLAGALFAGSVDVTTPAYVGTFAYRPALNARGTFSVDVRTDNVTALRDSASAPVTFTAGPTASVPFGATSRPNRR